MKSLIFVVVSAVGLHSVTAVTHSSKYFYTASSGIAAFPEFVTVGSVDDVPFTYYDSFIRRETPKQDWMNESVGPEYWERNTQTSVVAEQIFKANINIVKQRFNQTGGVHILQYMYGCDWDDETQQVNGYYQFGYDGEDFVIMNTETYTWLAPKQASLITTNKWNNDRAYSEYGKQYINQECPEWVKKYVNYGRSSSIKADHPSVSFLQRNSSSPVSCYATGFYPNRAEMFWRKDGVEIHEGVVKGEILPNNDGTFQMTVDIDSSSVTTEDWTKYECVFQLFGVNEEITEKSEKTKILTNESKITYVIIIITAVAVALAVAVLGFIARIGFVIYKKKNIIGLKLPVNTQDNKPPTACQETTSLTSDNSDDSQDSASSQQELLKRKINK